MKKLLMGGVIGLSVLGIAYADDDHEPMSGYAPFDSVTVTYRNKKIETLYCGTTGTHHNYKSSYVNEHVLACSVKQTDNPLFSKAQWIVVDFDADGYDRERIFFVKYLGKNCAVSRNGLHDNAWTCRFWQKLEDVEKVESGRKQEFPDDDIAWFQAKTPSK